MTLSKEDIIQLKGERTSSPAIQDWHDRMDKTTQLYQGDVSVLFKDETTRRAELQIPNTVQMGLNDISWLVSEAVMTTRCTPKKNTDDEKKAAKIREAVAFTYREYGAGAMLDPRLALDIDGCGAGFLLCYADKAVSKYPKPLRLNPRNCFPDLGQLGQHFSIGTDPGLIDTELHDLVVVTKLPLRTVNRLYKTALGTAKDQSDECEVVDYYDPDQMTKVIAWKKDSEQVQSAENPLGRVPVAFAQMDTLDGAFRGSFDQVGPIMKTLNRLYTLLLDDADRHIYSQPVYTEGQLLNPQAIGRPGTALVETEPNSVRYFQPQQASPPLFPLLAQLERFVHTGSGYPETRGSEPNASIISSLGISATLGVLKSQVSNVTRLLAFLWQQWLQMAFALDEKELNVEKPLARSVGNKYEYTPSKDVAGVWNVKCVYSPGAGINDLNERVGALQALGAKVVSKETVMGQLKEVEDPLSEQQKIDAEDLHETFKQRLIQGLDPVTHARAVVLMSEGKSLIDVAKDLMENPPQAPQAEGQPAQPEQPPGAATPEQVQTETTALQKGGTPQDNGEVPPGPLPPLPQPSTFRPA